MTLYLGSDMYSKIPYIVSRHIQSQIERQTVQRISLTNQAECLLNQTEGLDNRTNCPESWNGRVDS